MLNTVTGRILLTAQNQTRAAFSQATKDLRSITTTAATIGSITGLAAESATRGVNALVGVISQIPTAMLEVDTAFRDGIIAQARFENQMRNFNMGHMTRQMEDYAEKMQYFWGQSDDQILQSQAILARVTYGN